MFWSKKTDINKASRDALESLEKINYVDFRDKHILKYQEQYKRVNLVLDEEITDIYVENELSSLQTKEINLKLLNAAFNYER